MIVKFADQIPSHNSHQLPLFPLKLGSGWPHGKPTRGVPRHRSHAATTPCCKHQDLRVRGLPWIILAHKLMNPERLKWAGKCSSWRWQSNNKKKLGNCLLYEYICISSDWNIGNSLAWLCLTALEMLHQRILHALTQVLKLHHKHEAETTPCPPRPAAFQAWQLATRKRVYHSLPGT